MPFFILVVVLVLGVLSIFLQLSAYPRPVKVGVAIVTIALLVTFLAAAGAFAPTVRL